MSQSPLELRRGILAKNCRQFRDSKVQAGGAVVLYDPRLGGHPLGETLSVVGLLERVGETALVVRDGIILLSIQQGKSPAERRRAVGATCGRVFQGSTEVGR